MFWRPGHFAAVLCGALVVVVGVAWMLGDAPFFWLGALLMALGLLWLVIQSPQRPTVR